MRFLLRLTLTAGIFAATAGVVPHGWQSRAAACPGCKAANETDSRTPTAYMYSILFMLGMPVTIFSCFGVAFYRMSRREVLEQETMLAEDISAENS